MIANYGDPMSHTTRRRFVVLILFAITLQTLFQRNMLEFQFLFYTFVTKYLIKKCTSIHATHRSAILHHSLSLAPAVHQVTVCFSVMYLIPISHPSAVCQSPNVMQTSREQITDVDRIFISKITLINSSFLANGFKTWITSI